MSTQALGSTNDSDNPLVVVAADTYISSAQTLPTFASLPEISDGTGSTVAVGTEIRFEATSGSVIVILTADGRRVGVVPGYGQAVVVAEAGASESETDFWRFELLANTPAAFQSISASPAQAEIEALRDCLVDAGLMLAE